VDLDFTPEQVEFREEVRTWLAGHAPTEPRPHLDAAAMREYDLAWQRTQWEGGWAGIAWPERYGGRGLSTVQQLIWHEEYARTGMPSIDACFVGLSHAGPTLMTRGSERQKSFHLPRILRGEDVWCQGFSEPGAGSDLAALSTRAELDGDEFVVTGQKIWTSFAMIADFQELLVRTDRSGTRHHGITWLICDMHSPGIDVRPIKTMDGSAEFCEVFYDEVRVPASNVVGERDNGWQVAMSTLSFERGTAYTASQVRLSDTVEELISLARERTGPDGRRPAIADDELACRLATARAEVAALRAMTYAGICRNQRTDTPGPEGSMLKLYWADIAKRVARLATDILGPDSVRASASRDGQVGWSGNYLRSFAASIGGGTSEIQRNIIGDRVLGLPR
jgi:alkylation response protein AidB-like acyl-CoA dehydrogenase